MIAALLLRRRSGCSGSSSGCSCRSSSSARSCNTVDTSTEAAAGGIGSSVTRDALVQNARCRCRCRICSCSSRLNMRAKVHLTSLGGLWSSRNFGRFEGAGTCRGHDRFFGVQLQQLRLRKKSTFRARESEASGSRDTFEEEKEQRRRRRRRRSSQMGETLREDIPLVRTGHKQRPRRQYSKNTTSSVLDLVCLCFDILQWHVLWWLSRFPLQSVVTGSPDAGSGPGGPQD